MRLRVWVLLSCTIIFVATHTRGVWAATPALNCSAAVQALVQALADNKKAQVFRYANLWPDSTRVPDVAKMSPQFRSLYENSGGNAHDYLDRAFKIYSNGDFHKIEESSLRRALGRRGVENFSATARQTLEEISRTNQMRVLKSGNYTRAKIPEMREAESLVDELELSFFHNSSQSGQLRNTPTLSSQRLQEMGLGTGANSGAAFNREYLATDDQVFFWAGDLQKKSHPQVGAKNVSEYGTAAFEPDLQYSREHGWISAFIMNPKELGSNVGAFTKPDSYKSLMKKFGSIEKALAESPQPGELEEIRRSLHLLDFTVNDFENILKTRLLMSLNEMRLSNPSDFPNVLKRFQSEHRTMMKELVYDKLNLPFRWEFKIPVLVPADKFIEQ